jgi:uncharacterized phage protein (TIGR02220 family)
MHYYSFNIGDYAGHTSRLSPMEDLSYRRLLDLYYLSEQPISGSIDDIAREVGLIEFVDSVEYVLGKFFTQEENVFRQKRIDIEIRKYRSNAKNKSKAGKASAKARQAKASSEATGVEQVLNTSSTYEQLNINQEPITNNHKPLTNLIDKDLLSGKPDVRIVIEHFNSVTGQKLKTGTKSHSENISGRLSDGYSVDDLKLVIDFKNGEWAKDPKMAQYIRPATLFQTGKFGGYLAAAKTAPAVKTSSLHNLDGIKYESEDL